MQRASTRHNFTKFFNRPSLSFSYSYEKKGHSYQTNELRKVVKANYSWNGFSQKDIDIYTLNESIKNNQELIDDVLTIYR